MNNNLLFLGKMDIQDKINSSAFENYSNKNPWPDLDNWHKETFRNIYNFTTKQLSKYDNSKALILNAGSGGTDYPHKGTMIHLDIIESYINKFPHYIVSSIDQITLDNESVDIIICVGSVINYADYQKSIKEFSRILKPNGILILEFERSNSGEFLFKKNHHRAVFPQSYYYNEQQHILWMYNEKTIIKTMKNYGLTTIKKYRFHIMSTLLNRCGITESKSAKFIKADRLLAPFSYSLAHNCILISKKTSNI